MESSIRNDRFHVVVRRRGRLRCGGPFGPVQWLRAYVPFDHRIRGGPHLLHKGRPGAAPLIGWSPRGKRAGYANAGHGRPFVRHASFTAPDFTAPEARRLVPAD